MATFQKSNHYKIDHYYLWGENDCNFLLALECNGDFSWNYAASVTYAAEKGDRGDVTDSRRDKWTSMRHFKQQSDTEETAAGDPTVSSLLLQSPRTVEEPSSPWARDNDEDLRDLTVLSQENITRSSVIRPPPNADSAPHAVTEGSESERHLAETHCSDPKISRICQFLYSAPSSSSSQRSSHRRRRAQLISQTSDAVLPDYLLTFIMLWWGSDWTPLRFYIFLIAHINRSNSRRFWRPCGRLIAAAVRRFHTPS